ncbi:Spore wall maturation protein DIT1 [Daldinia childiae]|uniref:Spore wall maturation protein DIT1 n=1 Tax=Daldinia childiae TaxID=326645 RepID=UPI00144766A5|nr:Spore wall maturation protein DIT1 [Daldinia childiae]KAF3055077.1 Spore wall maturation protein DIT1 [Daldinia childiae]
MLFNPTLNMPSVLKFDTADDLAFPTALADKLGDIEPSHLETASRILNVISRYKLAGDAFLAKSHDGVNFLAQIYSKVVASQIILMCLPAFPFKSPNRSTKVLGRLPDKAEEFALAHLNGLCAAIGDIYAPGARLMIVSDGLVYNDLLGVPDKDVWAYGEALRALRAKKGFRYIEFCRLKDIVNVDVPNELDEIRYVANATNFRHALLQQFSKPGYNVSLRISEDEDTCLTYRGYIKFLETDLQNVYPVGEGRNTAFTTPWHCSIAFKLDGTTITGHRAEFDANDSFELVYEDNRPSYFREKSDLLSWATDKGGITCEPLYPAGVLIRPAAGRGALSIRDVDGPKVRALAQRNSPVILRGFSHTRSRDLFVNKSGDLGKPTGWKFGLVLEVKDRGADTRGLNNVLSAEWMPFHYDGLFKTEKRVRDDGSEVLVSTPPGFQFFTAVTESPKDTGFTLFSSSTLLFKYLPTHLPLSSLRPLTWTVSTSSFNSTVIHGLPLVIDHPVTGRPCLRYHEPWPQSKTRFEATNITIENASDHGLDAADVSAALVSLLHDRRVAYYHSWDKGDLLVNDNVLTMHTRSDFTAGCDRELWRINFD